VLNGDVSYAAGYTRPSSIHPTIAVSYLFCSEVLDSVLDYPTYFTLLRALTDTRGNLTAFTETVVATQHAYKHGAIGSGSFVENHDQPRLQSITSDQAVSSMHITHLVGI
jgi:glycosidase